MKNIKHLKINIAIMNGPNIKEIKQIKFDTSEFIEIPLFNNKKIYNRAKAKEELRQLEKEIDL